jgi:uncharacterized protein (TIGR02646 family)
MIRIERLQPPPAILVSRGRAKSRTLERAYTRSPRQYQSGSKCFAFDSGIYGHATVKHALIAAQYGKCCFCESKITHISYGDVEHFRPKAGYCQRSTGTLERPGYYWLAYEWENLLLCCQLCNQRHKRNYFPLANPHSRAICHRDSLDKEKPIFINPADENPEQYISFRKEVPFAVNGNRRGRKTITALGLDRPSLNEMRWDEYSQLEAVYGIAEIAGRYPADRELQSLARDARSILATAVRSSSQYAGMARAAVASGFGF